MPREQTHTCTACEQTFGSKWALTEHEKTCPVRRSGEATRVQEALEWKKGRIQKSAEECYRYAARSFAAHHQGRHEEARRFLDWLTQEFGQSLGSLEELNQGVIEASRVHFPRMERLKREVGTLIEQAKDLESITSVLNRAVNGGRR
jgi:hypothetical protein